MPNGEDMHAAQNWLLLYFLNPYDMNCPIRTMIWNTTNKANSILYETNIFLLLEIRSYFIKAGPPAG